MIGIWSYAARKVQQELKMSQVPYLAIASAFSFVAMIFTIPLPGGTSAHITGATLVAILLGPWAAVIAVSTALVIQALLFGDGGVTAIAANSFNIAFAGSLSGYGMYRLTSLAGRFVIGKGASARGNGASALPVQIAATAIASYVGINVAALLTGLELGMQSLMYDAGQGYFPYRLGVALPAILIPHLTFVGALEAIVSSLVFGFVRRENITMKNLTRMAVLAIFALLALQASAASAHDYWIERKEAGLMLVFGHGSQRLEFEAEKVRSLKALDIMGQELAVKSEKKGKGLLLTIIGQPAQIAAVIDNGYWSKTIYGWKEDPKRKASRVVEAIRQLFYTRALLSWSDAAQVPTSGHNISIVPLQNPFIMKAGETLQVKVLYNGNPLPDAELSGGEHNSLGKTDKDGTAKVALIAGVNVLAVEHKEKIRNDPDADALDETATLSFEVKK
jgi:cobalt/nickel transport system permease protein